MFPKKSEGDWFQDDELAMIVAEEKKTTGSDSKLLDWKIARVDLSSVLTPELDYENGQPKTGNKNGQPNP